MTQPLGPKQPEYSDGQRSDFGHHFVVVQGEIVQISVGNIQVAKGDMVTIKIGPFEMKAQVNEIVRPVSHTDHVLRLHTKTLPMKAALHEVQVISH